MKSKDDRAVEMMAAGANCAQAVLCAFCDELGLEKGKAFKLATGFGAGMGRKQEVCGAVTGGIMALGLRHGMAEEGDKEAKEATYRLTRELMARFTSEFGSFLCRELLPGCDLSTQAGHDKYKEEGLSEKVCRPAVRGAIRIVKELL